MTPITCAKPSPPRGRSPSSPTTRHVRSNIHSTSISMPSAISWNAASQNSSSSAASQPASKRPPEITGPSSLSLPSSYGCDKCPHHLGLCTRALSAPGPASYKNWGETGGMPSHLFDWNYLFGTVRSSFRDAPLDAPPDVLQGRSRARFAENEIVAIVLALPEPFVVLA